MQEHLNVEFNLLFVGFPRDKPGWDLHSAVEVFRLRKGLIRLAQ